jgi:ubiquinone/menaquinone biosynthesis C-methylase UbiE
MTAIPERTENKEVAVPVSLYDRLHLKMISLIHDSFYRVFVNPQKLLQAAGLKEGQKVMEVGCGPGFFTVPAAKIIGASGYLYSIDINPAAVARVTRKVEECALTNVSVTLTDASQTKLLDSSIDVAFLFGVLHSLKDLDLVLKEIHRVLNKTGIIAVQKSGWSEKRLLVALTGGELFRFLGKESRIYNFQKISLRD